MENPTLEINTLPIVSKLLYEQNDKDVRIIVLQTTDITMQEALMDQLEEVAVYCAKTYQEYEYALQNTQDIQSQRINYILLNPTEWKEWASGEIYFSNKSNVTTFIIDNSFTATCMADEIWEINEYGDTNFLVSTCFF